MIRHAIALAACLIMLTAATLPAAAAPSIGDWETVDPTDPPVPFGSAFASFNGRIWILGTDGLRHSADGRTWEVTPGPGNYLQRREHALAVFNGRLWLIGGGVGTTPDTQIWSSADGFTWRQDSATLPFPGRLSPTLLTFDGALWLMGGFKETTVSGSSSLTTHTFYNDVWRTTNGTTWTAVTLAAPWSARAAGASAVMGGRMWLIGGTDTNPVGDVWSSANGSVWTLATAAPPFGAQFGGAAAAREGNLYLATPGDRSLWQTTDGAAWTRLTDAAPWSPRWAPALLVHNDELTLVGGIPEDPEQARLGRLDAWSSPDGYAWRRLAGRDFPHWEPRWLHTMLNFNNRLWIIGGQFHHPSLPGGDVWSTGDGRLWGLATAAPAWGVRWGHASVVHNNRMWILGGRDIYGNRRDAWSSADGVAWTTATLAAPWPARAFHAAAVHNGQMFIMGGDDRTGTGTLFGDVWASGDGAAWTRTAAAAPWGPRAGMAAASFAGKLWLTGGASGYGQFSNEVWSSDDGSSWTLAATAPWSGRRDHALVVLDGRLWVFGGQSAGSLPGDVWSSSDGIQWQQESFDTTWPGRRGAAAAAFRNALFMTGGFNNGTLDETWTTFHFTGAERIWHRY